MTTTAHGTPAPIERLRERATGIARSARRIHPEIAALIGLAALLNLWALTRNGWANTYYSAAVRSMSSSWHDLLYGSFDAGGVMTVDKPPLALWVQALSVRVFGFDSAAILVPQALMGVVSVVLVYDMTRRRWGRVAGTAAGLAMATTPIAVAVSRHNNPDALLVLCCTAALWFTLRALEDGRTRPLVWAGVFVGLGFETKMGAALLVLPGLAAAWIWVAPRGRVAALRSMAAAGGALVAVGGAWPLLMWLTPASERPWISGTEDNSIWSLITGYNGLGRLDGQAGAPTGAGGGGGGGFFGGDTGPLRLLNESLGGQAGWLLGLAVAGGAITTLIVLENASGLPGWLGPLVIVAGMIGAGGIASGETDQIRRIALAVALGALMIAPVSWSFQTLGHTTSGTFPAGGPAQTSAFGGGGAGGGPGGGGMPGGGVRGMAPPAGGTAPGGFTPPTGGGTGTAPTMGGGMLGGDSSLTEAAAYAAANGGGTVVSSSRSGASSTIIEADADVADVVDIAAIGGFSGNESAVSVSWLADEVADGTIRWVLAGSSTGGGIADGRTGATTAMAAVQRACVDQSTVDASAPAGLYDCSGRRETRAPGRRVCRRLRPGEVGSSRGRGRHLDRDDRDDREPPWPGTTKAPSMTGLS